MCVWVWGWVMPISPAWLKAQVEWALRKQPPFTRSCRLPIGLTKGRLECGDLWSADLPFGPNHGFLTSGFQPEAGSLAPAFSQAARFISRLYGRYIRNQNQNQTRLRGGTYLIHVHLDLDLIALSQRVALWIG